MVGEHLDWMISVGFSNLGQSRISLRVPAEVVTCWWIFYAQHLSYYKSNKHSSGNSIWTANMHQKVWNNYFPLRNVSTSVTIPNVWGNNVLIGVILPQLTNQSSLRKALLKEAMEFSNSLFFLPKQCIWFSGQYLLILIKFTSLPLKYYALITSL